MYHLNLLIQVPYPIPKHLCSAYRLRNGDHQSSEAPPFQSERPSYTFSHSSTRTSIVHLNVVVNYLSGRLRAFSSRINLIKFGRYVMSSRYAVSSVQVTDALGCSHDEISTTESRLSKAIGELTIPAHREYGKYSV